MNIQKLSVNREISWLSFNARVLQEANDKTVPLVERIKFLGIFSSNLDEFFRVRVASLRRMIDFGKKAKEFLGEHPVIILDKILKTVVAQQLQFEVTYKNILKELEKEKIYIINEKGVSKEQGELIKAYFNQEVFSTLVPVMIDALENFPFLKDKSIYLTVRLSRKDNTIKNKNAIIEIPTDEVSRFFVLPDSGDKHFIILLDDIIRFCLEDIFSSFNFDTYEAYTIKLTRDAEMEIDNDFSETMIEKISKSLRQRKKGVPVRFVYDSEIPKDLLNLFTKRMHLEKDDLIAGGRYHNFKDFIQFPHLNKPHLYFEPLPVLPHKDFVKQKSMMEVIKRKDVLVCYPYQSFDYFLHLLREASIDSKVLSIKITLYRLGKNSKVVNALINAVKNGKEVTVLMELQARFDEEANIFWAKKMQDEGVKMLYSEPPFKVHCKLCIITKQEGGKLVDYANLGTGNYNEITSKVYSDFSLFTSDKRITSDVFKLFKHFANKKKRRVFRHLIVSPLYMRKKLLKLIEKETENALAGKEAYIIIKINRLIDKQIIKKLYEASSAGAKIKIIVRTSCALVPGIKGMSENIDVISIVDRFLEHARVFIFSNGGQEKYFLSSGDWLARNLDYRIETAFPIYNMELQQLLKDFINLQLKDNTKSRIINEKQDNQYLVDKTETRFRSQYEIYNYFKKLLSNKIIKQESEKGKVEILA